MKTQRKRKCITARIPLETLEAFERANAKMPVSCTLQEAIERGFEKIIVEMEKCTKRKESEC